MVRAFARIGCLSFGGPAGQIALMHQDIVDRHCWVEEDQFLRALNFCHLLPGPEAQQLATWIGWKLHGLRGGLAAGLLFVVPGALVILALSLLYVQAAGLSWFGALFVGIKAAVLALVVQALLRVAGRALNTGFKRWLAVAAFVALFALDLPFPLVVLGAGVVGIVVAGRNPALLALKPVSPSAEQPGIHALAVRTVGVVAIWLAIWLAPLAAIAVALGPQHVLVSIGTFFAKLAVVTFGGAYAVLAYMAQEAVNTHHWLTTGEMADGLGLAESTPGPLIMVTQFVGFIGAWRSPAPFTPLGAGLIGAALTTWMTFAPCFLWILAAAPWMERLEHARRLQGGLSALTAAVVGVIASLAAWFGLHVLFVEHRTVDLGFRIIDAPVLSSLDPVAASLTVLAFVLLFASKRGVAMTLALCGVAGVVAGAMLGSA
ncbi:chromate efflux transporter [Novosphingobium tardum]|uniref:Chromate efflux transporter n=1 Tax=Novosphingobium tardum TaxID=1538021 RepID=A0ABV8RU49_9SPHN